MSLTLRTMSIPDTQQGPQGRKESTVTGDEADDYPRRIKKQRPHELAILKFTGRFTDGTVALPDIEDVKQTEPALWEQTLAELEANSAQSEDRSRAAMTAAAFAFTIAGILLAAGSKVSDPVVVVIGIVAFLGFVAGLFGQAFYVGRRPLSRLHIGDVTNGLIFTTHKEFYAQVSMFFAALALGIEVIAFMVAYM